MQEPTLDQTIQLALQHYNNGQLPQAEQACRWILARNDANPDALNLMGILAFRAGRGDVALQLIERAVRLNPDSAEYLTNLGNVLLADRQYQPAIIAFGRALKIAPGVAAIYSNLGSALCGAREFDRAIAAQQTAIGLDPNLPEAWSNLGNVLTELARNDEAIAAYRAGLALRPESAEMHFNLSQCLLLKGDFETGWPEYEWRLLCNPRSDHRPEFRRPLWDGRDLAGKTILLQAEQGLGDTQQFSRYAPRVAARGGRVIVECQPELIPLLKQLEGVSEWVPCDTQRPPFDIWIPLLSLPAIFRTTLATIPAQPSLQADKNRSKYFQHRLKEPGHRKRIGLVWAGRPEHKNDHNRSLSLAQLIPLLEPTTADFISLQKGPASAQIAALPTGIQIQDLTDELRDFADTAALIDNLDLVIGVDTSVIHLAAAMDKATWLMLPQVPDWRWLQTREDSPWYPSLRLFRQTKAGDWGDVVKAIVSCGNSMGLV